MRLLIDGSNLSGTIDWLRKHDKTFVELDEEGAMVKLKSRIDTTFKATTLEEVDTDTVHKPVWNGVMGVVCAGAEFSHAADQRELVLYVSPSRNGAKPWIELS